MGDDMKDKLRELISTQDQRVLHDPNKFTSLMLDLCLGTNEREIKILATALTEKIPQHLQSSGSKSLTEELRSTLSHRLEIDCALQADAANWAVNTWAEALGMVTVEYSEIKNTDLPDKCDLRSPGKLAMPRPVYPIRAVLFSVIGVVVLGIVIIGGINFFGKSGAGNNLPSIPSAVTINRKPLVVPMPSGKIAYVYATIRTGETPKLDLYVMNADNSDNKLLANDAEAPTWSPDGNRIAFHTWRDLKCAIKVVNIDGSNLMQLADSGRDAVWSPDGKKIAFLTQSFRIRIIGSDGSGVVGFEESGRHLSWSPDSSKILFVGGQSDNEIFVMNVDGSHREKLLSTEAYKSSLAMPSYSPDGKQIAYLKSAGYPKYQLYVTNADGSNQRMIADTNLDPYMPRWSPAGDKIAFSSGHSTGFGNAVNIMKADGTGLINISCPSFINSFTWCFDGAKIAIVSDGIDIVNADGSDRSELLTINAQSADGIREALWSPAGAKDNLTTTTTTGNGKIAFMSRRDGKYQIYTMNADSTDQKRLTDNTFDAGLPSWSPDGKRIAFISGEYRASVGFYPGMNAYIIDADGKNLKLMTGNTVGGATPCWSPDSAKMALSEGLFGNLHLVSVTGDDARLLLGEEGILYPKWAPSGKTIIYQGWSDSSKTKFGIWAINANGTGRTLLCENGFIYNTSAGWSPDGNKICFGSTKDGNYEIYVMDADGSNQTRLTNNFRDDWDPCWSPDGKMIAFSSMRDGNFQIYVMNADGSNQRRLTNNSFDDYDPGWSPDGTLIAFSSKQGNNYKIYVMSANGTNRIQLTSDASNNEYPVWSPR